MNIIKIAKECGAEILADKVIVELDELQEFAQAVIENYKASLVPVAWMEMISVIDDEGLQSQQKVLYRYEDLRAIPLYALPTSSKNELPSGETK